MIKKEETERLIHEHLYRHDSGKVAIDIPNVRLDFKETYFYFGVTPSGNVKLGEIISSGPQGYKWRNKVGKVEKWKGDTNLKVGSGTGTNILRLD